ncbi:hypothetical protein [Stenomitos frigidus]|uniref:hypothetical protein n=1 Tax=Stenomitos frigidus TaxID=1886765 RepID=UPI0015E7BD57|nr:hypothetical protein [Stenomitos frigidus]
MSTQPNHFARKTTALLSAIAASSLLGLPALAGGLSTTTDRQAQAQSSPDQMQCMPMTQSNNPSSTATPDASATGAAQVPNQADPRTGTASADQAASSDPTMSSRMDSSAGTSSMQTSAPDTRSERSAYGDVLSQGGATAGGFASQQVAAANNPDGYKSVSSRYTSNDPRANYMSNAATMRSDSMRSDSMRSDLMRSDLMRSDSMSQPSRQSSRMTTGTTIARCPEGMMPRSSTPELRQAPGQPNPGMQMSPQPTNPQAAPQRPDSQTRQSPADDNGGRAR